MMLTEVGVQHMKEGITLVLSRWSELQQAVACGWGGPHSRDKAYRFGDSILRFFSRSNRKDMEDLEDLLEQWMESFSLVLEVDSIEQVARILMDMYEECLVNNYQSIQKLREAVVPPIATKAAYISDANEEDVGSTMTSNFSLSSTDHEECSKAMELDEAPWIEVPSKKRKGKKNHQLLLAQIQRPSTLKTTIILRNITSSLSSSSTDHLATGLLGISVDMMHSATSSSLAAGFGGHSVYSMHSSCRAAILPHSGSPSPQTLLRRRSSNPSDFRISDWVADRGVVVDFSHTVSADESIGRGMLVNEPRVPVYLDSWSTAGNLNDNKWKVRISKREVMVAAGLSSSFKRCLKIPLFKYDSVQLMIERGERMSGLESQYFNCHVL
ncbi:hypothetical protein KSS87_009830 [Heliosperma pusillum]|nr:hypothetical protein KSS87_009830 [Heliosperma pusillum]